MHSQNEKKHYFHVNLIVYIFILINKVIRWIFKFSNITNNNLLTYTHVRFFNGNSQIN